MLKIAIPIFLFLMCTNSFAQVLCRSEIVLQNYSKAIYGISHQISLLDKALAGSDLGQFAVSDLFDHNYKVESSEGEIKKLKEQIKSEGVAPEHQSLKNCLIELKEDGPLQKLKDLSLERHQLRIKLYEKNKDLKGALKVSLEGQSAIPTLKKELNADKLDSELIKQELEKDLIDSDNLSANMAADSAYTPEVMAFKKTLTKIKIDLLNKKLEYNQNLEEKLAYFEDKTRVLSLLASRKNLGAEESEESFTSIEKLWMEISNENLGQLLKSELTYNFPPVPSLPVNLLSAKDKAKSEILTSLRSLREIRQDTIQELAEKKEKEFRLLNELVLQTNALRSRMFEKLPAEYIVKRVFSVEGLEAIRNEVVTSPYRLLSFIYSKYYYVRDKLYGEKVGIAILIRDIFSIIFFVGGMFFLNLFFNRSINWLNKKQNYIVRRYYSSTIVKSASNIWNKVKDSAQSVLWLAVLVFLDSLESLSDYELVIDLVKIIIAVKILKSAVILFLSFVSLVDYKNFTVFKLKAEATASKFGNIFLTYNLSLLIVQAAIGEVFLYSIIKTAIVIYTLWQIVITTVVWEGEFKRYIERRFSGLIVQRLNRIFDFLPSYIRTICTFVTIIILSVFDFLVKLTENFEISKKISANLFKKQIESVEATEGAGETIPIEYREKFSFKSLESNDQGQYVQFDSNLEKNVLGEIYEWIDGKSDEHSLVLFGDKGVGKTTFLKRVGGIIQSKNSSLNLIYTKMPSKILKKEDLQAFIKNTLALEEDESQFEMLQIDRKIENKTVVVIDEAQNLFLSKTGGFEAYYYFTELVNVNVDNIFWVLSFNKYSWLYLDRAFGRTQFFRNVFELRGWSDVNIKELIMKRHSTSEFKLSYDLLISATRSQDEMDKYATIEAKFFKLLWELSRGNPRAALSLWITALSMKNKSTFNVNIPKEPEITGIDQLSDDLLFVLAFVLKHENLSANELEKSTNLPKGIVRNAIKVSLERNYLYRDKRGRFMIDINQQHPLIKYLRVKNFVYGS